VADVPDACPSCGTKIPPGRTRCPGCGKVFGEDNRCPSCNAVTGIVPAGAGYVCAACSAPRVRLAGTIVLGSGTLLPHLPAVSLSRRPAHDAATDAAVAHATPAADAHTRAAFMSRGRATGLRLLGAGSIGVGVLAATALGLFIPGVAGLLLAAVMGGGFVTFGALSLRAGAKATERASSESTAARELAILSLAEKSEGDLTATEVARGLGISLGEADGSLTAMADGSRVAVEVDPEGVVHYVFRELRQRLPVQPRVRVDASIASRQAVDEALELERTAEAEAEVEAEAEAEEALRER
jgi:hypothetical protein